MKKMILLAVALLLCLSLTACGGMNGNKAAAMYPDIIGEWGTDPFGEDFVLTLASDGTCTILGNTGTWKLNKKTSNEEFVILTLKTEALDYYVKFNRRQPDRRYMFDSVRLLVMDAKQEVTIYEGSVYTQGDQFISPELALHTIPEVIGEWGSPYWAEEPIFTIREDGTCTVVRQPGRWLLWRDFSTWPKIVLLVKLDNGIQYESEFVINEERGFNFANFDFYDRVGNNTVSIDPNSDSWIITSVNRSKVQNPAETFPWVLGSWYSQEDHSNVATFHADGTCTLRGTQGVWGIDTSLYSTEDNDRAYLLVKVRDLVYRVYLRDWNDNFYMNISIDGGITIMDSTHVTNDAG